MGGSDDLAIERKASIMVDFYQSRFLCLCVYIGGWGLNTDLND